MKIFELAIAARVTVRIKAKNYDHAKKKARAREGFTYVMDMDDFGAEAQVEISKFDAGSDQLKEIENELG